MHVFLTGDVRAGKTTALNRALDLTGRPAYGFRTCFGGDRRDDDKTLYMLPAHGPAAPEERWVVTRFRQGRPWPDTAAFDRLGVALLAQARAHPEGVILMDECSRFEKDALAFHRAIGDCLDGDIPVLGVVRQTAQGWVDAIRRHPRVCLLTVTALNRDALPAEAAMLLLKGFTP